MIFAKRPLMFGEEISIHAEMDRFLIYAIFPWSMNEFVLRKF